MPRLSALVAERTIAVKVGNSSIEVTYDEAATTSAWLTRIQTAVTEDDVATEMATVLIDWDLTDDNDEPWPNDADGIARLPLALLAPISRGLGEDVMGKKGSGATSSRKARRARARSGTPESEPAGT